MEECWNQLFKQIETKEVKKICCDNPNILALSQWVCVNCGLVNAPYIDPGQEYNLFDDKSTSKIRCNGTSNNHDDFSLSTIISTTNKVSWSRLINYSQKETHKQRVVKELKHKFSYFETFGFSENILNSAISFFIDFVGVERVKNEKKIIKGKKRTGMMGICVYFAYKQDNCYRTKEEIAKILKIPCNYIEAAYEKYYISDYIHIKDICISKKDIIQNYCVQFEFDFKKMQFIILLYSIFCELNIVQIPMRPRSQIIGLFYFIMKEFGIDTSIIFNKIKISKFTVEKVYKILLEYKVDYFNFVKKKLIIEKYLNK